MAFRSKTVKAENGKKSRLNGRAHVKKLRRFKINCLIRIRKKHINCVCRIHTHKYKLRKIKLYSAGSRHVSLACLFKSKEINMRSLNKNDLEKGQRPIDVDHHLFTLWVNHVVEGVTAMCTLMNSNELTLPRV